MKTKMSWIMAQNMPKEGTSSAAHICISRRSFNAMLTTFNVFIEQSVGGLLCTLEQMFGGLLCTLEQMLVVFYALWNKELVVFYAAWKLHLN